MNTQPPYFRPYEMQQLPNGDLQQLYLDSDDTLRFKVGKKESIEFVNEYFEQISNKYPWHIIGVEQMLSEMDKLFVQCKNHPFIYKARIVEQSVKCLFGAIDEIPDRDEKGIFHVEHVCCPLRGRCKWDGYAKCNQHKKNVICNPVLTNDLKNAEFDVARLLAGSYSIEEIASMRNVTPNTIRTQRLSIYRKLNITSREQLTELIRTQRLK